MVRGVLQSYVGSAVPAALKAYFTVLRCAKRCAMIVTFSHRTPMIVPASVNNARRHNDNCWLCALVERGGNDELLLAARACAGAWRTAAGPPPAARASTTMARASTSSWPRMPTRHLLAPAAHHTAAALLLGRRHVWQAGWLKGTGLARLLCQRPAGAATLGLSQCCPKQAAGQAVRRRAAGRRRAAASAPRAGRGVSQGQGSTAGSRARTCGPMRKGRTMRRCGRTWRCRSRCRGRPRRRRCLHASCSRVRIWLCQPLTCVFDVAPTFIFAAVHMHHLSTLLAERPI